MLHWKDPRGWVPWSRGSAPLILDEPHPTGTLPMAVRCRFGSLAAELAMLDTGAYWTLIGSASIELLGAELGEETGSVRVSSRLGSFPGTLHRLSIHLIADQGESICVDGTCLALPDWRGPNVLGVHGCLERLRFALEPDSAHTEARIHFGPV